MPQTFRLTAHQILSRYLRQAALAVLAGLAGVTWSAHAQTVTHATAATAQAPVLLRVVGGLGNVEGAMAGGFILGIAEVFAVAYGSSTYRDAVAFGIIILILFIRPEGLFSKAGKGGRP